jgi:hypothetical protein
VFPDGNCCLGTLQSTIPDLVAKYEFSTLVQVMLSYLGEVNMLDGAGRLVHHWPLLNKDGSVENDEDRMKRIKEFEKTTAFSAPLREDRQDAIAAGVEAGDDNEDEDDT